MFTGNQWKFNPKTWCEFFAKTKNGRPSTIVFVNNEEFDLNDKGNRTKSFNFSDTAFKNIVSQFINNLKFQISYAYIDSDNRTDMQLNGLAYRENGKFVIRVGEKTWTYDSYNEFYKRDKVIFRGNEGERLPDNYSLLINNCYICAILQTLK